MNLDEFQKADLRVGEVLAAERVEGSEKLLKLDINIGEKRQILSGIGKFYAPEALVGKQVIVIANLEPRMMMGLESQGMVLAADDGEKGPVLLSPLAEVAPGTKIK